MSDRSIPSQVKAVLAEATAPMTSKEIAASLPGLNFDSVRATVGVMARKHQITRMHSGDGILRYRANGAEIAPAGEGKPARVYAAPLTPSEVRIVSANGSEPGSAAASPPVAMQPTLKPTLQQLVQAVVCAGDIERQWNVGEVVAALTREHGGSFRADEVRDRLANLSRSAAKSPLRRMPNGRWMVNTVNSAQIARAMCAETPSAPPTEAVASIAVAQAPAEVARVNAPADNEHAERALLRELIGALIITTPRPAAPVMQAMRAGLELLGVHAR